MRAPVDHAEVTPSSATIGALLAPCTVCQGWRFHDPQAGVDLTKAEPAVLSLYRCRGCGSMPCIRLLLGRFG